MRFEYPVETKDVKSDVDLAHYKGTSNQFGYYPLGVLKNWHGGIHIEGLHNSIRAMADGHIIAYRMPDKYSEETINGVKSYYSNGFVLMQHCYTSPKGESLVFYSLYNHLRPYEADTDLIPPPFAKGLYKVKQGASETMKVMGIQIWDSTKKTSGFTIPNGSVVETENAVTIADKLTKDSEYRKMKYSVSKWGKEFAGYYMATAKKFATRQNDTHYTVTLSKEGNSYKGVALRTDKNKNAKGIIDIIPAGTTLQLEKEDKTWSGVLENKRHKGYVLLSQIELVNEWALTIADLNKIKNCSTPIPFKAGTIVGYSSHYGFEKHERYCAAHIEIFTPQDINSFLTKIKTEGEKSKHYVKIAEGTELENKFPYKLITDTEVKVVSSEDGYSQIEIGDVQKTVPVRKTYLGGISNKKYSLTTDTLANTNPLFGGILTVNDKLNQIETDEAIKLKNDKKPPDTSRIVSYSYSLKGKKFWIPTSAITIPPEATDKKIAVASPTLNTEVTELFYENPAKNPAAKVEAETIIDLSDAIKYTGSDKKTWSFVTHKYFDKTGVIKTCKGFIKPDILNKSFSAFDWEKFGFIIKKDSPDDYIFDCKAPAPLLNGIWELIDTDGDKVLEPLELNRAFHNHYIVSKLSRLICYHYSEWALDEAGKLADLKKKIKEMYNKGVNEEEDLKEKEAMEAHRDEKLAATEAKVKNLSFWSDIHFPATENENAAKPDDPFGKFIAEPVSTKYINPARNEFKEKQTIQKLSPGADPHVYHFHPISFVEQMRKMECKKDIDLRNLLKFEPQTGPTDCNITCKRIMGKIGIVPESSYIVSKAFPKTEDGDLRFESYFQLADENKERTELVFRDLSIINNAYDYLDKALEFGHPVLVGVNHSFNCGNNGGYNEGTTDHYVIIVGRKYINGDLNYVFWDVGTSTGATIEWLFEKRDNKLIADLTYRSDKKSYIITQIRRNLDNDGKPINY